mmetsp:Transcript_9017/g.16250  ORF Transcript_9017/g.16250 Transcript_9017/m.16250 type:complete len:159 (-) Transcript_9017:128-604(-)
MVMSLHSELEEAKEKVDESMEFKSNRDEIHGEVHLSARVTSLSLEDRLLLFTMAKEDRMKKNAECSFIDSQIEKLSNEIYERNSSGSSSQSNSGSPQFGYSSDGRLDDQTLDERIHAVRSKMDQFDSNTSQAEIRACTLRLNRFEALKQRKQSAKFLY